MKEVVITVFMAVASQTDETPSITASGYEITGNDKIIAVSRDLLKEYPYGSEVKVKCDCPYEGIYRVEDTMNKRYNNTIDVLVNYAQPIGKWKGAIQGLKTTERLHDIKAR